MMLHQLGAIGDWASGTRIFEAHMNDTQASTDVMAGPLSLHTSEQLPFYCSAVRNDEGRAKPQLRGCSQGLSEMKMLGSQRRKLPVENTKLKKARNSQSREKPMLLSPGTHCKVTESTPPAAFSTGPEQRVKGMEGGERQVKQRVVKAGALSAERFGAWGLDLGAVHLVPPHSRFSANGSGCQKSCSESSCRRAGERCSHGPDAKSDGGLLSYPKPAKVWRRCADGEVAIPAPPMGLSFLAQMAFDSFPGEPEEMINPNNILS
ncbi:hypothetical protein U0070_000787 [Myodes glareolus]|uniref:Uncharacterized protein n=1 Tax=Myodes glareolus TaxID=447135 RepID=A0AAW0I6T5_MYOGA